VLDEEDRIAHVLEHPLEAAGELRARIDWPRRFDHMQQHTGQHLLSAVLVDLYGAETVGFHMGAEVSTIDLTGPALTPEQWKTAELRCNEIVAKNRPVTVSFQDSGAVEGLRKPSERTGLLRVVTIDAVDRSACGGTHVRATGEIGFVSLRGVERVRGNTRLEFVCGLRAVRRARADLDALTAIARSFSAGVDETPRLVAAQVERLAEADKLKRKLAAEVASYRGRQLYAETEPLCSGVRFHSRAAGQMNDDLRVEAQAFTSGERAVFLAWSSDPAALLLAASKDAPVHAGNELKPLVTERGGRGGGSAQMAQGSVPDSAALKAVVDVLVSRIAEQR
jgi:alanyl-tRNA synthetase